MRTGRIIARIGEAFICGEQHSLLLLNLGRQLVVGEAGVLRKRHASETLSRAASALSAAMCDSLLSD